MTGQTRCRFPRVFLVCPCSLNGAVDARPQRDTVQCRVLGVPMGNVLENAEKTKGWSSSSYFFEHCPLVSATRMRYPRGPLACF